MQITLPMWGPDKKCGVDSKNGLTDNLSRKAKNQADVVKQQSLKISKFKIIDMFQKLKIEDLCSKKLI